MPFMNRDRFQAEFEYEVEKDFDVDGVPASWADKDNKSAHRFWGDEDSKIHVPSSEDETGHTSFCSAISPDGKFIAASGGTKISIYDIETKECRTEFNGLSLPCRKLLFCPSVGERQGYVILIGGADPSEKKRRLYYLELDSDGHRVQKPKIVDIESLVTKSLAPVIPELDGLGIPSTSPLVNIVREQYTKAIEKLQSNLEVEGLVHQEGSIAGFGSRPFSSDGKTSLYLINNETTQHGKRPPAELPQIVVYDAVNRAEKHVLEGHEDAIIWTEFSPDNQHIASASWDGTFRIFDAETGKCNHIAGPTGGQCWRGEWSPDSKHILFCGRGTSEEDEDGKSTSYTLVAVHSVETGKEVARFRQDSLRRWVRHVSWSPGGEIAIAHETEVWIWKPFEDRIVSSFAVKIVDRLMKVFASITELWWANSGDLLIMQNGDYTVEVWDRAKNLKWRVQRPTGVKAGRSATGVYWVEQDRTLISLDGDGCLRFYQL